MLLLMLVAKVHPYPLTPIVNRIDVQCEEVAIVFYKKYGFLEFV